MIPYADRELNRKAARAGSAARTFSSIVAWSFAAIPILGLIGGIIALLIHPYTAYVGVAAACVILIIGGNAARAARRRRARVVVAYLAQAIEMNLPISPMLLAAAQSETAPTASRINKLRTALEDGSPVGDAVAFAVPHVPQRVVDLANAAERNGRLPQVLGRLLDEHYPARRESTGMGLYGSYALMLLLVVCSVVTMLTIFVIPKYQQLLRDFRMPMPAFMRLIIVLGQSLVPIVGLIALVWTLITEGRALRQLLSAAHPRVNPLRGVWDHFIWYVPIVGTLARDRGLADVCMIIANAVEAGRPVDQAIGEAVQPHLNAVLRARIDQWATLAAGGMTLTDAARRARLPALVGGLIGTAVRAGNLPSALRFLAGHYESSFSRTAVLLQSAVVPALVLTLGTIVMGVALALFEPIIALIQQSTLSTRLW